MEMQIEDLKTDIKDINKNLKLLEEIIGNTCEDDPVLEFLEKAQDMMEDQRYDAECEIERIEEEIEYLKDRHQWYDDLDIGIDRI